MEYAMFWWHACRPHQTHVSFGCGRSLLYGQLLPTFCATGIDHFSTVFGLHACAKSVGTFAGCVVGLIGSFHVLYP